MAKVKSEVIRIYNKSKQTINLQVKPPGGDFYLHEQTVHLQPGKTVKLPKDYVNESQIANLQKSGQIQVIFDSEAVGAE